MLMNKTHPKYKKGTFFRPPIALHKPMPTTLILGVWGATDTPLTLRRELFFALTGMQRRAKKSSLVRRTQDGHRVSREGGEGSHIRADKRQCIVGGSRQICGRHLYAGSAYLPQRSLDSGPMHKLLWVPVPFRILGWEEDTEDSEDDGEDEDTDDSDSGGHDDDEDDEYEDGDDETRR